MSSLRKVRAPLVMPTKRTRSRSQSRYAPWLAGTSAMLAGARGPSMARERGMPALKRALTEAVDGADAVHVEVARLADGAAAHGAVALPFRARRDGVGERVFEADAERDVVLRLVRAAAFRRAAVEAELAVERR